MAEYHDFPTEIKAILCTAMQIANIDYLTDNSDLTLVVHKDFCKPQYFSLIKQFIKTRFRFLFKKHQTKTKLS